MSNPYDLGTVSLLVARQYESLKVDYKVSYPIHQLDKKAEFIKDIVAMANTIEPDDTLEHMGLDPNYGYIIIGADEGGGLHDISADRLDDADLQQIVNEVVEPPIKFQFLVFDHDAGAGPIKIGLVVIEPSESPPHRLPKGYKGILPQGAFFSRNGTRTTRTLSDAQLERLYAWRARFSDLENRLQQAHFKVADEEWRRLEGLYVKPTEFVALDAAYERLRERGLLMILGDTGSGKRSTALRFAQRLLNENVVLRVLNISRYVSISDVQGADGAVIVVADVFGYSQLERLDLESERKSIENLLESNFVILTSTEPLYEQAVASTRLGEWDLLTGNLLSLDYDAFSKDGKELILKRHMDWAIAEKRLVPRKASWVINALESKPSRLSDALIGFQNPGQVRRFVDYTLPRVEEENELLTAIDEQNTFAGEIGKWFADADEHLRCFLMVLAVFNGFERELLQDWYEKVVGKLRELNPLLKVLPYVQIYSDGRPYIINQNGVPVFSELAVQGAVLQAVASGYRTYFVKMMPDFALASVPTNPSQPKMPRLADQNRRAISTALSEIGKTGLDGLIDYIESLADCNKGALSAIASEILAESAEGPLARNEVFDLLRKWLARRDKDSINRRWAAVVALGKLGGIAQNQVVNLLTDVVSKDRFSKVRSKLPEAFRPFTVERRIDCAKAYTALAKDQRPYTRREVSTVLARLAYTDEPFVDKLLQDWSTLTSPRRLWTLARTCFVIRRPLEQTRLRILTELFIQIPVIEAQDLAKKAFRDVLKENDLRVDGAWKLLGKLLAYDMRNANSLAPFAVILTDHDPEKAREEIEIWANAQSSVFRTAAASILVNIKVKHSEFSHGLLSKLTADLDQSVALTAQLDPFVWITDEMLQDDEEVLEEDLEEPDPVESNPLGSVSGSVFGTDILG